MATTTDSDRLVHKQMGRFSTDSSANKIRAVYNDHLHLSSDWSSAPGLEKDQF